MLRFILALLCCLVLAAPAWAGFDEGLAAYNRGDYETALREFRPLAEQGVAVAQYNLGLMYRGGQGVPSDDAEAVKWYRLAAKQGHAGAQNLLGEMYAMGRGVPQNYAEAARWYRKAAERGDANAQNNLGLAYGKGQGVPQNYTQAHMWLNLAAAQGFGPAAENREIVAERMTPADVSKAQRMAWEWLVKHGGAY